jgi:hypothetical protein
MDFLITIMDKNIKEIFRKEREMEKGYTCGQMVHIMMDFTDMI